MFCCDIYNTHTCCHPGFDPSSPVPTKQLKHTMLLDQEALRNGSIWYRHIIQQLGLQQSFSDFYHVALVSSMALIGAALGPVGRPGVALNTLNLLQSYTMAGCLCSPGGGGGNTEIDATFGSNASMGMVVYVDVTGDAELALADAEATTGAIGLAAANVAAGEEGKYVVEGLIEQSDWTAVAGSTLLVPGATYYLDPDTPGMITPIAPIDAGDFVVVVGRAVNTTTLDIEIAPPILLSGNTSGGGGGGDPIEAEFDSNADKGMVVYVTSAGTADLAKADAEATVGAVGMAAEDVLAGETKTYLTEGQVQKTDWSSVTGTTLLTPGAVYFLSESSAGMLTTTAPTAAGDFVLFAARALSTTTLDIEVGHPVLLSGNTSGGGGGGSPITAIFDSAASEGMAVYIASDGHVDLAQADSDTTTGTVGLANADVLATATGDYITEGQISQTDWTAVAGSTSLTAGAVYYLDPSTAGMITSTPTTTATEYVTVIGRALTSQILDIEIGQPILLSGNNSGGGSGFVYALETFIITSTQEAADAVQLTGDVPTDSEFVFLNGVQLLEGVGDDYTFSGSPTLLAFAANIIHENDILIIKYSS